MREAVRMTDEMARRVAMAGGEDLDLGFRNGPRGGEWRLRTTGKGGRGLGIGVGLRNKERRGALEQEGFAGGPGPVYTEISGACLLMCTR